MAEHLDQLQELVDTMAEATGCPATLEDRDLNLVASSGHEDVIDEVRSASILRRRSSADVQMLFGGFGIARSERPLRIPGDPASKRLGRWCIPIRWRQVTYGYLWLLDPDEVVQAGSLDELRDVVDQAAGVMARRARTDERVNWAAGELMSDDPGTRARAIEELRNHGVFPPTGGLQVVALARRHEGDLGPVNSWLLPRTVVAATMGRRAALVIPEAAGPPAPSIAARVAENLLEQHPGGVAAGISDRVDPVTAHLGWRQASAALTVALHQLGTEVEAERRIAIKEWAELGVLRLLSVAEASLLGDALADDRLRRLQEVDPDLVRTVRVFLDNAGAATDTANLLSIHRQTLYQRLRRVTALTGLDLSDGSDRLLVHVALVVGEIAADHPEG